MFSPEQKLTVEIADVDCIQINLKTDQQTKINFELQHVIYTVGQGGKSIENK